MYNINIELLITLINERSVIWDQTLKIYKNKVLRETAWREICNILNDDFEEMDEKQRQKFGKLVVKKWTHIRDSWFKDVKKRKNRKKSGNSVSAYKPYKYSDQLSFLKKINNATVGQGNDGDEQTSDDEEETVRHAEEDTEYATTAEIDNNRRKKTIKEESTETSNKERKNINTLKRKQKEVDKKNIEFLNNVNTSRQNEENPQLHFFKSLLPVTSTLNADETLQFQAGVINLLQSIKKQKQAITKI